MINHDPCDTASPQNPMDLSNSRLFIRRVVDDTPGVNEVERFAGKLQILCVADKNIRFQPIDIKPFPYVADGSRG
jgi:hypothetical protein